MVALQQISIDELDRALIAALMEDGRMSFRAIGERIGLTGEATRDRYDRLKDQGVVRVVGLPHPASFGLRSAATVGISVTGAVAEVACQLARIPNVSWMATTFGAFEILLDVVGSDDAALYDAIDTNIRTLPGVRQCSVLLFAHLFKWGSTSPWGARGRPLKERYEPSDEDKVLMAALMQDGRASFTELAEIGRMSYPQARRYTRALLGSGILQINTVVNRPALGVAVLAAIGVRVEGKSLSTVAETLAAISDVELVVETIGVFDLLLEVACSDRVALRQLIHDRIRTVTGVAAIETFVYVRIDRLPVQWDVYASVTDSKPDQRRDAVA